jgi:hypothetical protein
MPVTDRTPPFDIDEFLDALPSHRLQAPRPDAPANYQESRWPLLKPWNGFTGIERRRGGQLIVWLQAAGCLSVPRQCDICGSRERVGYHSEAYYHVARPPALCRLCHFACHQRHNRWDAWRRIVDASTVTGREWFALAPRHGIDLAQHLRDRWGWHAADIEKSPLLPLPDTISTCLPGNMLAHPSL